MQRSEELVERDHLDAYATLHQRERRQIDQQALGTTLTDEERNVRAEVAADSEIHELYDQYLALTQAHGLADLEGD